MTTNQSLRKPMLFTFKQGLKSITTAVAVILCGAITFFTAFFTLIELFTSSPIYDDNWNITEYIENKELYHYLIFCDANEFMTPILLIIIAAGGVLAAICTFNFITSKKMVNVYYSLGITRAKLFCGKYFSGLLLLFIAVFFPLLLTFIGNVATVGYSATLMKAILFYLFKFTLTAFTSYTITSAVFAVVGTTFETAIFSAIILFIPDIFLYSVQMLMDKFLYGNPYGYTFIYANDYAYYGQTASSLPERFSWISPVFWGKEQINEFALAEKSDAKDVIPQISPNFIYTLVWFAICVAVFFLAVLLFNRRKAEICGFIGTNRYLNSAVSLLAAFSVFSIAVSFVDEIVLGIALGALAFAIVHLLLEIIVLRDLKKFARGLYKLPVGIAVSIAIVFIFNSGFFGYSQNIPETENIQSVAVTYVGTNTEYGLFNDSNSSWQWNELGYYEYSNSLAGEFTTKNDINAVLDAHKLIAETAEEDRTIESNVQFVYTLKDGSIVKRNFASVSPDAYKKLLYLEDCNYYDEQLKKYFKGDIKEFKQYEDSAEYNFAEAQKTLRTSYSINLYSKYMNKEFTVNLTENDKKKLLDALYNDIMNRSAEEKYYPAETPVAFIYFNNQYNFYGDSEYLMPAEAESTITENDYTAKYTDYPFCYNSVYNPNFTTYITTDMVNTIQLLKDMGLYEKLTETPEFVSAEIIDAQTAYDSYEWRYITSSRCYLSKYSASKSESGQEWENYTNILEAEVDGTVVTEQTVIDELLNHSYTVYEQDDIDMGWFVCFKTAEGDSIICYIPDGKLPSSVK